MRAARSYRGARRNIRKAMMAAAAVVSLAGAAESAEQCRPFTDRHMEVLRATGLEVQALAGRQAADFMMLLAKQVALEEAVPITRVVVLFEPRMARILLLAEAGLCNVITGPIDGVREMLTAATSEPA